ncbi:MAG: outer membrane protein assembly factor BamB family protein, partial [Planctomycetota bacterium]
GELLYFRHAANGHNGKYFLATRGNYFFNSYKKFSLSDGETQGMRMATPVLSAEAAYCGEPLRAARPGEPPMPHMPPRWTTRFSAGLTEYALRGHGAPRIWIRAGSRLYGTAKGEVMAIAIPGRRSGAPQITWRAPVEGRPTSALAAAGRLYVVTLEGKIFCFGGEEIKPKVYEHATENVESHSAFVEGAEAVLKASGVRSGYCAVFGGDSPSVAAAIADGRKIDAVAVSADAGAAARARRALDRRGQYGRKVTVLRDEPGLRLPPYFASLVAFSDKKVLGAGAARTVARTFRILRPYGGTACFPAAEQEALAAAVKDLGLKGTEVRASGAYALLVRKGPLPGAGSWTHQYGDPANTSISDDDLTKAPLGLLWFGGPSNRKVLPRHGHGPNPQVAGGRVVIEGPDMLRAVDAYTGRLLWEAGLPGLGKHFDTTRHQPGANATNSNYVTLPEAVYVVHEGKCLRLDAATGRKTAEFSLPPDAETGRAAAGWGFVAVCGDVLLGGASPQELYDPEFSPDGIKQGLFELEGLDRIIAWLREFKGFKLDAKRADESRSSYAARHLNRLLGEKNLAAMLPEKPDEGAAAVADRIRIYLRENPGAGAADPRLRELNRALLAFSSRLLPHRERREPGMYGSWSGISSRRLVAMDRNTGKVLWQIRAGQAFAHNAVCAGGGRVYCVDMYPPHVLKTRTFIGRKLPPARLLAVDLKTGKRIWSTSEGVFAPFLSYSAEHDVLLQAARPSRDHLPEYTREMAAHSARDGKVLWRREISYRGPPMLHGKRVITQRKALDLLTGKPKVRTSPITGKPVKAAGLTGEGVSAWRWQRHYGCGAVIGSRHLLTFRSAAAGYYDLLRDGGTGNLGGFRAGCSNNLIVADGVLAAPDYTRTCKCGYPNQSSLGLLHDPGAEMWTFNAFTWSREPVERVGLNFGAPGDRVADSGTLWLDWPSLGYTSPDLPVDASPLKPVPADVVWPYARSRGHIRPDGNIGYDRPRPMPETFRMHSTEMKPGGLLWVASSGLKNVRKVEVDLGRGAERSYTVRLHFCEPEDRKAGERVFFVFLQNRRVLQDLDIVAKTGGPRCALMEEIRNVRVKRYLKLEFVPREKSAGAVISGMEIISEK